MVRENVKPDNITWSNTVQDYKGPDPDWNCYWSKHPCESCGTTYKTVTTSIKSNGATYHRGDCANGCVWYELPHFISKDAAANYEVPFGSHKGKKLIDTPKSWRQWVLGQQGMSKGLKKRICMLDEVQYQERFAGEDRIIGRYKSKKDEDYFY